MDYIAEAKALLEKRANAFEQRKAITDDAVLSDAEKAKRCADIDADMARWLRKADEYTRQAEGEAEVREIQARTAKLAAGTGAPQTRTAQPERDVASELRDLARGRIDEVSFNLRTATSGTASNAGNTKATTFVAEVIEAMRERSEFFSRARVMTTSGGETIEWPVKNGLNPATAPVSNAAQVNENTAYAKGDQSWTKTNIGAYKYGVIVEATREIVDDSELDILSILAADAGESVADVVLADLMVGTGTNEPWGWITRATGAVNAANLAGVTFDNLLDLQYAVKAPYRRNGIYMFNDTAIGVLRKLKDADNRYLWQASVAVGQPDTIHGKPVLTDPNILTSGAGAKIGVFGDAKKYLIRQVKDLKVTRSDEYGFDRDVIAFKVSWRGSGDLFDTNSVKALTVTA